MQFVNLLSEISGGMYLHLVELFISSNLYSINSYRLSAKGNAKKKPGYLLPVCCSFYSLITGFAASQVMLSVLGSPFMRSLKCSFPGSGVVCIICSGSNAIAFFAISRARGFIKSGYFCLRFFAFAVVANIIFYFIFGFHKILQY